MYKAYVLLEQTRSARVSDKRMYTLPISTFMLTYIASMPNTKSAKKAVRSSAKKRTHNLLWKHRIKTAVKTVKDSIRGKISDEQVLKEQMTAVQQALDKAQKEKVIHKNKANRLKSKYAKRITALGSKVSKSKVKAAK